MLVSAEVSEDLRQQVAAGARPCPEFLALERDHGVRLLDWTAIGSRRGRSAATSARHVARALGALEGAPAVFSDGEHLGLPLAVAAAVTGKAAPHMMIGHRLLDPRKRLLWRALRTVTAVDRVVVHSRRQAAALPAALGVDPGSVVLVPYGVDTGFWAPVTAATQPDLVFAAGREHRDYRTLAAACAGQPVQVVITAHSSHSPRASHRDAAVWPANVTLARFSFTELRAAYQRAAVVVVPLVDTDFPAGITAALEAMAMAKPVICSATPDMAEIVEDGSTGVLVPPGDEVALRRAVRRLLADPDEGRALGVRARAVVLDRHRLDAYAATLAHHLGTVAGTPAPR